MADARIGKPIASMSGRAPDYFTVPMCSKHHREQHEGSERMFWDRLGIDPILTSLALYAVSGDYQEGIRVISGLDHSK